MQIVNNPRSNSFVMFDYLENEHKIAIFNF